MFHYFTLFFNICGFQTSRTYPFIALEGGIFIINGDLKHIYIHNTNTHTRNLYFTSPSTSSSSPTKMTQFCAACRAAPATMFCSADAAFLCTLCDITVHDANKLSRRHTRLPLNPPSTENTLSCETAFEESDASSFLPLERDPAPLSPYAIHQTHHPLPDAQLACIAGAFVKQEAQTLLASARNELPPTLAASWSCGTVPVVEGAYSDTEERDLGPVVKLEETAVSFGMAFGDMLAGSVTTDEESNMPVERRTVVIGAYEQMERSDEQKRLDRQAALKRFRHKRANRSFRKKVRYECRKQLADSRPRVKGRFVGRAKVAKGPAGRIQRPGQVGSGG